MTVAANHIFWIWERGAQAVRGKPEVQGGVIVHEGRRVRSLERIYLGKRRKYEEVRRTREGNSSVQLSVLFRLRGKRDLAKNFQVEHKESSLRGKGGRPIKFLTTVKRL